MVVLSASICNRNGKVIVARQFIEMTKSRVEGLLLAFPKLISSGKQHTFVETDSVRYIYQPLDSLYLVLITNKSSNILQDISTLNLFARTISEFCRQFKESEIISKAYDLIMAFDEIISFGYRNNVNVSQIKTCVEMESHEEKLQEMLQKSKEREAIEAAKLKAKQLEMQRKEAAKRGIPIGGGSSSFSSSSYSPVRTTSQSTFASSTSPSTYSQPQTSQQTVVGGGGNKGMQLGSKPKVAEMLEAIRTEEGLPLVEEQPPMTIKSPVGSQEPQKPQMRMGSVHIVLDEKMTAVLNRDGGLDSLDVKGELLLRAADANHSKIRILLETVEGSSLQFKTHPQVDKNLWASKHSIAPKDLSKPFPVGQALPVLKWRFSSKDDNIVPFSLNFWPSPSGSGTIDCSVEYEFLSTKLELQNVVISIPIPSSSPKIDSVDGDYGYNPTTKSLEWRIPLMDSSSTSGTLEFSIPGDDVSVLFPVNVLFTSPKPFCDIEISGVELIDSGESVDFTTEIQLSVDDYRIV